MPKLTLYTYWRSSASHRVRLALGYKGIAYEPIFVNLLEGEQRQAAYKAKNPMGYLPCLDVDGELFTESTAILELLEELHPTPALLPSTAADRARVRALAQIVNSGIQPLQNLVVLDRLGDDKDARLSWLRYFIARGLEAFDALATRFEREHGKSGEFSFGERFGMADVFLLPQLYAARRFGVDLAPFPKIVRADAACQKLAFVAPALPDNQPDAKPA